MATLLYSCTMSLDGFLAGPGGDMSWLSPYVGPNSLADGLVDRVGALLVGRRTYFGDDPNRGTDSEGAFGGRWTGPQFVLTSQPDRPPSPGVTFLDDLDAAVSAARAAAGDRYVNVLGADVARQLLAAGHVDEILVFVAPVLLGDGVPFFRWAGGHQLDLEWLQTGSAAGASSLWYRVRTPGRTRSGPAVT